METMEKHKFPTKEAGVLNPTEEFLDKYKQLEQAATAAFGWDSDGRAVHRMEKMRQFEDVRQELGYMREVRNLLSHNCKVDGAYAVEPSGRFLRLLDDILRRVQNPLYCKDICTPIDKVFSVNLNDRVLPALRTMQSRRLSHVPVLEQGRVAGILSENAVFAYLLAQLTPALTEEVRVRDLRPYIAGSTRRSEVYRYLSMDATVRQAEDIFESFFQKGKRVCMFFLTDHGHPEERLRGIMTPWDVLGN